MISVSIQTLQNFGQLTFKGQQIVAALHCIAAEHVYNFLRGILFSLRVAMKQVFETKMQNSER